MNFILKNCLYLALLASLAACAGQNAVSPEGGFDGGPAVGGPVGGGQGQPTIAPGADHQPGVPVDEEDDSGPTNLAAPGQEPDEPEEPQPAFQGATDFKK